MTSATPGFANGQGCSELHPKAKQPRQKARAVDLPRPALLPVGMPRHLPKALTLVFNRLALIPLQLKREAMPPKKRRPRRKRKPKRL